MVSYDVIIRPPLKALVLMASILMESTTMILASAALAESTLLSARRLRRLLPVSTRRRPPRDVKGRERAEKW